MGFNYGNYGIVPPQACISQVCKCVWLPIDSATNDAIQDKEEGISIDNSLWTVKVKLPSEVIHWCEVGKREDGTGMEWTPSMAPTSWETSLTS